MTTTGSPAWFIWALPFLVIYQSNGNRITAFVVTVFALLFTVELILKAPPSASTAVTTHAIHDLIFNAGLVEYLNASVIHSTVRTALVAIGIILGFRVWRDAIRENNFFHKPFSFLIGIAGDSGSGKDTYADSIVDLFRHPFRMRTWRRLPSLGPWSACVAGNHAPQPMANDIDRLAQDVLTLKRGLAIRSRHYNHTTGMISKPRTVKSNDLIIVSGLL